MEKQQPVQPTSSEAQLTPEFPYAHEKIPVAQGADEFVAFVEKYPDYAICPYVAFKDSSDWDKSTSRVYMNQLLPRFLYVPGEYREEEYGRASEVF
jgi:hypothetical protein